MITLRAFMAITNYGDTSSANTSGFAKFGYAKKIRQTAVLNPSYRLKIAKHVATTRHMVRTIMQLPTFVVHISSLARTSGGVVAKSAKDEVAWEVERSRRWMC
jgi:hypothetical protein